MNNCLYTFGGWLFSALIHELNLTSMVWRRLKAQNSGDGPLLKCNAGMVAYGSHMVCVLGGIGKPGREHIINGIYRGQKGAQYDWDSHQRCYTNELHLFHVEKCKQMQALPFPSVLIEPLFTCLPSLLIPSPSLSHPLSTHCRCVDLPGDDRHTTSALFILHPHQGGLTSGGTVWWAAERRRGAEPSTHSKYGELGMRTYTTLYDCVIISNHRNMSSIQHSSFPR